MQITPPTDSRRSAVSAQGSTPQLVGSLARVSKKHPLARKLLVCPTRAVGRELLRRLSLSGEGWIGFEVTTPRPLALRLARPAMEPEHLVVLDAFEARALLDDAMDVALRSEGPELGALADGVGFREAVHGSIEALRLAGIGVQALDRARLSGAHRKRFLRRVLQRYEQLLSERRRVDTAEVFRLGLAGLEAHGARLPPELDAEVLLLLPGLGTRGLTGKLIAALSARGARVMETDPVHGLDTPPKMLWRPGKRAGPRSFLHQPEGVAELDAEAAPMEIFRAASIHDELREVLRRVVERGLSWDQVEIITPDPAAYGSALHAEAVKLRVPVTFAVGLPIERTRVGRVVRTYLDWIEGGFQADPVRRLLEAGDLRPRRARGTHAPAALARRFRSLRIGWGRRRYREQIREAIDGLDALSPGHYESMEAFERRRERTRGELEALRSILFPTLKGTPTVPDRMGEDGVRVSPAEIARGLRAFLRRVPRGRGPDRQAREEVERILERIEATLGRRTAFRSAVTVLRRHLDLRVRASAGADPDDSVAPWSSEGGHLHLSDLEHGGFTGREAVFLVGMDADRAPGFVGQDPVLLDADRRILGEDLPTSTELHRERVFRLAALFARLRGALTMSYAAWDATQARTLGPSPLLLQALRLARADPALTYASLEATLGRVVSVIPPAERPALDGDDVWMSELGKGEVLRAGTDAVARTFSRLAAGLASRRAAEERPGPARGVLSPRPDVFDPRRNPELVVSASRLEALGTCPLRYLQSVVLGIRPPDDPELDPDRWLDPLRRGALLHDVFEQTLREVRAQGLTLDDPRVDELSTAALASAVTQMRAEMPVPGEGALRRERAALENDVRSFLRMVRLQGAPWIALELRFGLGDDEPVVLETPKGPLRLRGAIDRIDEDLNGLRVIDYKTGVAREFAGRGTFHGGRRLQHAIYAHVAEQRLGGMVSLAGYHFPTIRGQNQQLMFDRLGLAGITTLLDRMLDGIAGGSFVPTERADDCKFCDFAAVCRVRESGYGKVHSALADWSEEHLNAGVWPAFADLKRVRKFED
ncbi:MAG TPA: PD-(D/E)XK nuclease family protein [Longimicrobiales bacterium]|nr:PD-(D/E)XK nuclease family protein [Longimicrobiales bacterium]